jgi:hypothetical protein
MAWTSQGRDLDSVGTIQHPWKLSCVIPFKQRRGHIALSFGGFIRMYPSQMSPGRKRGSSRSCWSQSGRIPSWTHIRRSKAAGPTVFDGPPYRCRWQCTGRGARYRCRIPAFGGLPHLTVRHALTGIPQSPGAPRRPAVGTRVASPASGDRRRSKVAATGRRSPRRPADRRLRGHWWK